MTSFTKSILTMLVLLGGLSLAACEDKKDQAATPAPATPAPAAPAPATPTPPAPATPTP